MKNNEIKIGDKVTYAGFEGVVVSFHDERMSNVYLDSGQVCVCNSDLIIKNS